MSDDTAITLSDLSKTFGEKVAVDRLNLEIRPGELFGLVGPDGAGKTTTMRMLTAIMRPTSGEAWVAGHSVLHEGERIREKIGYMSQRFGLYEDLTVMENVNFYADLFVVPKRERGPRIERLLGFSNLTPFKNRLAGRLSGGMKQKLGLACALIHTPEVLFLDEPTNGVDPVSRRDFWKILYDLLKEGITILVSTAYLDEAERCTRIGLMHQGRILMNDEPHKIKASLSLPMFQIWLPDGRRSAQRVKAFEGVGRASMYGDSLHVTVNDRKVMKRLVAALQADGVTINGTREIVPSLEDVFISMIDKKVN